MIVRPLRDTDDLCEVSGIYESSWRYAYKGIVPQEFLDSIPKGKWVRHSSREDMHHIVLEEAGRLIGTASYCSSRWEEFSGWGELVSIYLLPEYIGSGRGELLLEEALRGLAACGYDRVMLWVLEENRPARHFYEKHRFSCAGIYLEDEIGGKPLREVAYTHLIEKLGDAADPTVVNKL